MTEDKTAKDIIQTQGFVLGNALDTSGTLGISGILDSSSFDNSGTLGSSAQVL